jgi:hypothetical protein
MMPQLNENRLRAYLPHPAVQSLGSSAYIWLAVYYVKI